jgi:hypothetical protein
LKTLFFGEDIVRCQNKLLLAELEAISHPVDDSECEIHLAIGIALTAIKEHG